MVDLSKFRRQDAGAAGDTRLVTESISPPPKPANQMTNDELLAELGHNNDESEILTHDNPKTKKHIEQVVRASDAESVFVDSIIQKLALIGSEVIETPESVENAKLQLTRLIDDDFPFDVSQLAAINGMVAHQFACMTGAAGTGKTTSVKKLIQTLMDILAVGQVDMSNYWKKKSVTDSDDGVDPEDEYDMPEDLIPALAMVSFTGRATQMIKKNFPRDWHSNIMTIHRLLGFVPEFYDDFDDESGLMVKKRRFMPTYTKENKFPFKIIVMDEAGMTGTELAKQFFDAMPEDCRVYMVGDINQLPPTHGKSVFGFAMANWPSWELTHIHRQKGANNSIVDNAHRILKGAIPISDCKDPAANCKTKPGLMAALNWVVKDPDWKFAAFEIDEDSRKAAGYIRMFMELLKSRPDIFQPNRDALITPINGYELTAQGSALGQFPLNRELAVVLNKGVERYYIDGGREKPNFAPGDKVMATRNDYATGITNGMTGIIESIVANGNYIGDSYRFGPISEVQAYMAEHHEEEDTPDLAAIMEMAAEEEDKKADKEANKGQASHIITVRFGEGEHSFTIPFSTFAEVSSVKLAYAMTCHKMQGGEAPFIMFIVHQSHKRPLCREWGYTAQTRGSQKVIMFYTRQGRGTMLSKQNIKGTTLKEKVASFQALQKVGILGAAVSLPWLPSANQLSESPEELHAKREYDWSPPEEESEESEGTAAQGVSVSVSTPHSESPAKPAVIRPVIFNIKNLHLHAAAARPTPAPQKAAPEERVIFPEKEEIRPTVAAGVQQDFDRAYKQIAAPRGSESLAELRSLTPEQCYAMAEAYRKMFPEIAKFALTYQPQPAPEPAKKLNPLQLLIAAQQAKKGIK